MTRSEIKDKAQRHLMSAMQIAFTQVAENSMGVYGEYSDQEGEIILAEMDEQMKRVEKLFGFKPGSWTRGC